ncbi:MAG: MBL fold metallo-hydrolase [Phycisphaerales bacterium]
MLPSPPAREGQLGFLYLPPYRVQGISVAGEQTVIQVPELDVAFDIGQCTRSVLSVPTIALSHAHMDHLGGLPYWFSQRYFQKIGGETHMPDKADGKADGKPDGKPRVPVGRCICHPELEQPLRGMMRAWEPLERQKTPFEIVALEPEKEIELKNNISMRAIATRHTVPSLGFSVLERRSKLKEEFRDLPQEKLRELRSRGTEITRQMEIPLVAYTGDTAPGEYLVRDEFAEAKIVIAECTFFEPDHNDRARTGMHLHIDDIIRLLPVWKAEAIVLVHVSRRTTIHYARERIEKLAGADAARIHLLMDHRTNRMRYEAQVAAAQESADKSEAARNAKAAGAPDAAVDTATNEPSAESQGQTPTATE